MSEYGKLLGYEQAGTGRKRARVVCACGALNLVYVWSWAGHGKARCRGCNRWIIYGSLAVKEPKKP